MWEVLGVWEVLAEWEALVEFEEAEEQVVLELPLKFAQLLALPFEMLVLKRTCILICNIINI